MFILNFSPDSKGWRTLCRSIEGRALIPSGEPTEDAEIRRESKTSSRGRDIPSVGSSRVTGISPDNTKIYRRIAGTQSHNICRVYPADITSDDCPYGRNQWYGEWDFHIIMRICVNATLRYYILSFYSSLKDIWIHF